MFRLTPLEVDWAQVIGAGGVLGIPIALAAIAQAKRDLLADRRAAHELEVLRALSGALHGRGEPENIYRIREYLMMIPGSDDLPMWRAAFDARPSNAALDEFAQRFPDVPGHERGFSFNAARDRVGAVGMPELADEMHAAIERRLVEQESWLFRRWRKVYASWTVPPN